MICVEPQHHHEFVMFRIERRRELDRGNEADIADVDDVRRALQCMRGLLPMIGDLAGSLEEPFLLVDLQGGEASGWPE